MRKSKADQTEEGIYSIILSNISKGTTFFHLTNCVLRRHYLSSSYKLWFSETSSLQFKYADILAQCAGYAIDNIYGDACKVVSDFGGSIRFSVRS